MSIKQLLDIKLQEISGAFLFGIPLIYTMEMWWIGKYAEWWKLLIFLLVAFGVCTLLSYYSRADEENRLLKSLELALDSVAVGIVAAVIVLTALNQINADLSLKAVAGMVAIQSVPLSIGASAARSILNVDESKSRQGDEQEQEKPSMFQATMNDIGATLAGSIFIGLPVAPTDEIPMLAVVMNERYEIALVILTLLITYAIVFASGFDPEQRTPDSQGIFQRPLTETVMAYVIALMVSLLCLLLFDRISPMDSLENIVSQVVVLGLPAAIGGAAGRLVI